MMCLVLAVPLVLVASSPEVPDGGTETGRALDRRAPNPFGGHLLDASGYLLPRGRGQIGFFETKYGIFDVLNVGTSPYPWLLGPLLEGFSANVSAKAGFRAGDFAASLEVRYVFVDVKQTEEKRSELAEDRVSVSLVPITGAVSWAPDAAQTYSFATRFVVAEASAAQSVQSQEVAEGAAASNALHLVWSARWRFTRVFGLYARAYLEPWAQNLNVEGDSQPDEQTRITVRASIDTQEDSGLRWSALAGTHLAFGNVNVRLGMGYGFYFPPLIGLTIPTETFFPDFDIYVRF